MIDQFFVDNFEAIANLNFGSQIAKTRFIYFKYIYNIWYRPPLINNNVKEKPLATNSLHKNIHHV